MTIQEEYQIVCDNIRYLRKMHDYSRTAMAKKLHITLGTLDFIEKGELPTQMGVCFFFHVEREFGISPRRLLTVRLAEGYKESR